jgi:hypothetical protein
MKWNTMIIRNMITAEDESLRTSIHVSMYAARHLRSILQGQCFVILMTRCGRSVQWVRMICIQPPTPVITHFPSTALYNHPTLPGRQVAVQGVLPSAPGLYPTNALDIEMQSFRQLPVVTQPYSTMKQSNASRSTEILSTDTV